MNIRIKWAKNVQLLTNSYFVPLYASSSSHICPVLYLMCYLKICRPGSENEPLFINKKLPSGHIIPLTTSQANRWLHLVIQNSRLVGQRITYHSLRRGYSSDDEILYICCREEYPADQSPTFAYSQHVFCFYYSVALVRRTSLFLFY